MKDWNYSGIAFLNELCGSACFRAAQGFQDCCAGFVVYSREQRTEWRLTAGALINKSKQLLKEELTIKRS